MLILEECQTLEIRICDLEKYKEIKFMNNQQTQETCTIVGLRLSSKFK